MSTTSTTGVQMHSQTVLQLPCFIASDDCSWKSPAAHSPLYNHSIEADPPALAYPSPLSSSPPSSSSSSSPSPVSHSSSIFVSATVSRRAGGCRQRAPRPLTRPRNAFILFRSAYVRWYRSNVIKEQNDDSHLHPLHDTSDQPISNQNELSIIAANIWNAMTAEEKRPYCMEANVERERHRLLYPGFAHGINGAGPNTQRKGKGKGKGKGRKPSSSSPTGSLPEITFLPLSEISPLESPPRVEDDLKHAETFPDHALDNPSILPHIDMAPDHDLGLDGHNLNALNLSFPWLPAPTFASYFEPVYTFPTEPPVEAPCTFFEDTSKNLLNYHFPDFPVSSYPTNEDVGSTTRDFSLNHEPESFFDFSAFAASTDFQSP